MRVGSCVWEKEPDLVARQQKSVTASVTKQFKLQPEVIIRLNSLTSFSCEVCEAKLFFKTTHIYI